MTVKEIERIRGSVNAIEAYRTGMNALFQAGVIDALRVLGRPKRVNNGSDIHEMASEGSWSAGWNDCLDTLLYFQEVYLDATTEIPNVKMEFGALDRAVKDGDLTKEESDALRNNRSVVYKPGDYTKNIDNPKRPKDGV